MSCVTPDVSGDRDAACRLTKDEHHTLIVEWNRTSVSYPPDLRLHELFEVQAERTPDRTAVVFEGEELTYQELNVCSNQLARSLQALGVGSDVLVGVCMERSLEMVVAIYAVAKAGGAYVPLDPDLPADRLCFMAADSGVAVVLTQEHLRTKLPQCRATVISLDRERESIGQTCAEKISCPASPDDLAYVLYTSGSTGTPKGVMNTHRGICNRLLWMQDAYPLTEQDRVLQKTPFSFDVSVWEFFWPLSAGACLILATPGGHKDSRYLVDLIREQKITTLHFVPSMLDVFLNEDTSSCSSLKRVFCSGEVLPYALQERFFAKLSSELHNLYGPTEAAVDVTFWKCSPQSGQRSVPIGRPVANTTIYILDTDLQPVPVGEAGELCIGGVQVARGYLNRPALTAEKFIPDPFSQVPGARLYRSGDLARYLPGGIIEYLGRTDHQVKIRGFRVELGEIEAVLGCHESVRQAVLTVREDIPGDKQLAAYILCKEGRTISGGQLRQYLRERLPEHMIPSVFTPIRTVPLSPNGKIDRKGLPAPMEDGSVALGPDTALERTIAGSWETTLLRDRISMTDNFFDLGGNSLRMIQVRSRLQEALKREISMLELFRYPTIRSLAAHLSFPEEESARGHHDQGDRLKQGQSRLKQLTTRRYAATRTGEEQG